MFLPTSGHVEIQVSRVGSSLFLYSVILSRLRISAGVTSVLCTALPKLLQYHKHCDVLFRRNVSLCLSSAQTPDAA